MTESANMTAGASTSNDGRFLGALLFGICATLAAGAGLWILGMTGYVWADRQLWGSSSWSHSAGVGTVVAMIFFGVWAALMLVTIVIALAGTRRVHGRERRGLVIMAAAVPVVSILLILMAALVLLGQGGAQLIPLEELL